MPILASCSPRSPIRCRSCSDEPAHPRRLPNSSASWSHPRPPTSPARNSPWTAACSRRPDRVGNTNSFGGSFADRPYPPVEGVRRRMQAQRPERLDRRRRKHPAEGHPPVLIIAPGRPVAVSYPRAETLETSEIAGDASRKISVGSSGAVACTVRDSARACRRIRSMP